MQTNKKKISVQLISNKQKGKTTTTTPFYDVEFSKLPVTDLGLYFI